MSIWPCMIYVCRRSFHSSVSSGHASLHELQCIRLMQSAASVAPRRHFLLQLQYLGFASRTKIWRKSLEHRAVLCSVQRAVMMFLSSSIDTCICICIHIYIYVTIHRNICILIHRYWSFSLNKLLHCLNELMHCQWCTWWHLMQHEHEQDSLNSLAPKRGMSPRKIRVSACLQSAKPARSWRLPVKEAAAVGIPTISWIPQLIYCESGESGE